MSSEILEALLADYGKLHAACHRSHSAVKVSAEKAMVEVRNCISAVADGRQNSDVLSSELLGPFILSCTTSDAKLIQISLSAMNNLLLHDVVPSTSMQRIVEVLQSCIHRQIEEVKILQCLNSFGTIASGDLFANALSLCICILFSKSSEVINAATAIVQRLVFECFDRLLKVVDDDENVDPQSPAYIDAYRLFNDLCLVLAHKKATWLTIPESFRQTFILELFYSIICKNGKVFVKLPQFNALASDFLFTPVIATINNDTKQYIVKPFPYYVRFLRILHAIVDNVPSIAIKHCAELIEMMDSAIKAKNVGKWKLVLILELIRRIVKNYAFIQAISLNSASRSVVFKFISEFVDNILPSLLHSTDSNTNVNLNTVTAFAFGDVFVPLITSLTTVPYFYTDQLDKHEAPEVLSYYSVDAAYLIVLELTHSVYRTFDNDIVGQQNGNAEGFGSFFSDMTTSLYKGLLFYLNASIDDDVSNTLLAAYTNVLSMACQFEDKHAAFTAIIGLCQNAFPENYFDDYVRKQLMCAAPSSPLKSSSNHTSDVFQICAMNYQCPTPAFPLLDTIVKVSIRHVLVAQTLIRISESHLDSLGHCWDVLLATFQHFLWLTGVEKFVLTNANGEKAVETTGTPRNLAGVPQVTYESPELQQSLLRIVDRTGTASDDVLCNIMVSLVKLCNDQAVIATSPNSEISFFPVWMLFQVAVRNIQRYQLFWQLIMPQLADLTGHQCSRLRDTGLLSVNRLTVLALKDHMDTADGLELSQLKSEQEFIMKPLFTLASDSLPQHTSKKIDSILQVLELPGLRMACSSWTDIFFFLQTVLNTYNATLIKESFAIVEKIGAEAHPMDVECFELMLDVVVGYGEQYLATNTALSAVGILWQVADHMRNRSSQYNDKEIQKLWLSVFRSLARLCVSPSFAVRRSACDTFLQTVATHIEVLDKESWLLMMSEVVFPFYDAVLHGYKTSDSSAQPVEDENILIHHSRDTPAKQWADTVVKWLSGVVRIFSATYHIFSPNDAAKIFNRYLTVVDSTIRLSNAEMTSSALTNFNKLVSDRLQATDGKTVQPTSNKVQKAVLICAWTHYIDLVELLTTPETLQTPAIVKWLLLLEHFVPLFESVFSVVKSVDFKRILTSFSNIATRVCGFATTESLYQRTEDTGLLLVHERVLGCLRAISVATDLIHLKYADYGHDFYQTLRNLSVCSVGADDNLFAFCEKVQFLLVESFLGACQSEPVFEGCLAADVISTFGKIMQLHRYAPAPSSCGDKRWEAAAQSFFKVIDIVAPTALKNPKTFTMFWLAIVDSASGFIFCPGAQMMKQCQPGHRQKHEYYDCQMVDVIKEKIINHAYEVPPECIKLVVDLLSKASMVTADANVTDFHQRTDLCTTSFGALMALSQLVATNKDNDGNPSISSLGNHAVISLLARCKTILDNYARAVQSSGYRPLSNRSSIEVVNVLNAICVLLKTVKRHTGHEEPSIETHLVDLHPTVVQLIPSSYLNSEVQLAVMTVLNSFFTFFTQG